MRGVAPESIQAHYAIVSGRRYPPKQVIAAVTGLDRSAFISTQARRILERLGFTVGRVGTAPRTAGSTDGVESSSDERLAREAEMLRPYRGRGGLDHQLVPGCLGASAHLGAPVRDGPRTRDDRRHARTTCQLGLRYIPALVGHLG